MYRASWLFDKRTDLALFTMPLLVGAFALYLLKHEAFATQTIMIFLISQFFGLGPLHMGPGWSHFTDPKIFQHIVGSGKKKFLVLAILLSILTLVPLVYVWNPLVILSVYIAFTIHHLTQQNIGILRLYQNHESTVIPDKTIERKTINWAAWLFSAIFILRTCASSNIDKVAFSLIAALALVLTICYSTKYFRDIFEKQKQTGLPINTAACFFWGISIAFFIPLAFLGSGYTEAIMIPLVMHWVQYLGLNWILLKRKQQRAADNILHFKNSLAVSIILTAIVLIPGAIASLELQNNKFLFDLSFGLILSLSFIHYLQDAILWKFSDPVLKKEILYYLKEPVLVSNEEAHKLTGVSNG